jgi:hypothetical protein
MGTHENYIDGSAVVGPSDRKFGITLGFVLLALAALRWHGGSGLLVLGALVGVGVTLLLLGIGAPSMLTWPNRAWFKLGLAMAAIITPVAMLVIFVLVFVPLAFVMRLRGRDLLVLRRKPASASYWVERDPPGPQPATMIHQF